MTLLTPLSAHDAALGALMTDMGDRARSAGVALAEADASARTRAIRAMASEIRAAGQLILEANARDMQAARERGVTGPMLERLELNADRVSAIARGVEEVAALPDPVGRVRESWRRPNGLEISRVSTPIGVIGIIYESRPNVTADAGALCVRSGNACILRGGSESLHSSSAIAQALRAGLGSAGLPEDAVQLVPTADRAAVGLMLAGLGGRIDVIVPRGGKTLVARVQEEARAPVLAHLEGLCHTYVHSGADPAKAEAIVLNAKLRRTSVCGSTETLLIDEAVAPTLLPRLADALRGRGCELRGDRRARELAPPMLEAAEADWSTEYLDAILSVAVVADLSAAVAHIRRYGSQHTDAIVTEDAGAAERFLREVDSAIVMHNASTQFADGGEFGMGAEIGIATGRLHARGPVGAEQLTTFKYVVRGDGQTRP